MVILEAPHYVLMGLLGFFAIVWSLLSMGVVRTRDHDLHTEKHAFTENAIKTIETTYNYLEQIPIENRDQARAHLHRGELHAALESAQLNHDVYHFFKNH
ncbi:uncharacterized protein METZ01_LOCUS344111 [marine metagenome]|uniref:Uncharacterized protein n=1 Tax=marine metagenome TaxID=408172 RepID=A0A382R206_9ZZZZ